MILTEKHIIKDTDSLYKELDRLCFLSKNLYNATLYAFRQYYFETGEHLGYNSCYRIFKDERNADYYALPTKVSQGIMRMVDQNYKSFFGKLKKKKKDEKIGIPRYLDKKEGRFELNYNSQAISVKEKGYVKLSGTSVKIKTDKNVNSARVVHRGNHIVIELIYEIPEDKPVSSNIMAGIDIGLNNLATVGFNNKRGFIINGKPLKSINQYYNKKRSELKSDLERRNKRKSSKRIRKLDRKRKFKVSDYLHKSSNLLVNQLVSNNVSKVIIGKNKGWKQEIGIGKRNNQNFVQIPHAIFIEMISYKCSLKGIRVVTREESYTSKCSFLDNEPIKKHEEYKGRRIKRGLFKTSEGLLINADLNGALNILRKEVGKFNYPIEVSSSPLKLHIGLS